MATTLDTRDLEILNAAAERFETRLGEEVATLATRQELAAMASSVRQEMASLRTDVRGDIRELRLELRGELKSEIANTKADLLKWSFLFWVGQVAVVFGLASLLR